MSLQTCLNDIQTLQTWNFKKKILNVHKNENFLVWLRILYHFIVSYAEILKVPKCEIFDCSDFPDFYTIKSRPEGDFGVKFKKILTNI